MEILLDFNKVDLNFFRLADPIHHEDLFKIAEAHVKNIESKLIKKQ